MEAGPQRVPGEDRHDRDDRWDGILEQRARFARQVMRAVRVAAGNRVAVTAKLNMVDGVHGRFSLEDSRQEAQ